MFKAFFRIATGSPELNWDAATGVEYNKGGEMGSLRRFLCLDRSSCCVGDTSARINVSSPLFSSNDLVDLRPPFLVNGEFGADIIPECLMLSVPISNEVALRTRGDIGEDGFVVVVVEFRKVVEFMEVVEVVDNEEEESEGDKGMDAVVTVLDLSKSCSFRLL